jgi:glycosyltransferase involved in cell wall biosynthesis
VLDILVGADVNPDPNSGAAGTVMETSKALAALGHRVESFWSESLGRRIAHGNLHYILELPRAYRAAVRSHLARQHFDVVQLSQPHAWLAGKMLMDRSDRPLMVWRSHGLEAKVDAAMARHAPGTPGPARNLLRRLAANRLGWAQRQAVRWSDGAIVPCEDDKAFLVQHFGAAPERVRVIWHGVPDDFIEAPQSMDPHRWRRILHVSQLSLNKGPDVMTEVAARVLAAHPQATMTWVCPQPSHARVLAALPLELHRRIELRDWTSRQSLMALLDSHGLFLFPTLSEGAAKVVMEAMARGMCVVSSDTSGPADYIRTGDNGWLVPVGDSSAMVNAAGVLLADEAHCARMGTAAALTAHRFRWSRCANEAVDFYEALKVMRDTDRGKSR